MIRRLASSLRRHERGATIIEFALVAPVMLVLMMGSADLAYQGYLQAVLNGAIQKAGRDSGIQGGAQQTGTIDQAVMKVVWTLAKNATYTSSRKSYYQFSNIKGEPFVDSQKIGTGGWAYDGICNHSEAYTDLNDDGSYSLDPGTSGQGGANDAVLYTIAVTYPRLFPMSKLIGWSSTVTLTSSTILKNQPFASQSSRGSTTRNCT